MFRLVCHLDRLDDTQLALLRCLLRLVLVDCLHYHLDALGDVNLHRVDGNLETELVCHLLDVVEVRAVKLGLRLGLSKDWRLLVHLGVPLTCYPARVKTEGLELSKELLLVLLYLVLDRSLLRRELTKVVTIGHVALGQHLQVVEVVVVRQQTPLSVEAKTVRVQTAVTNSLGVGVLEAAALREQSLAFVLVTTVVLGNILLQHPRIALWLPGPVVMAVLACLSQHHLVSWNYVLI